MIFFVIYIFIAKCTFLYIFGNLDIFVVIITSPLSHALHLQPKEFSKGE